MSATSFERRLSSSSLQLHGRIKGGREQIHDLGELDFVDVDHGVRHAEQWQRVAARLADRLADRRVGKELQLESRVAGRLAHPSAVRALGSHAQTRTPLQSEHKLRNSFL
jgi:hypothetical protein